MLMVLVLASVMPALALGAAAIFWSASVERDRFEVQLQVTARALALGVDRQFGQAIATVESLAVSPSLSAGDLVAFDAQARRDAREGHLIGLVDAEGRQRFNTAVPPDTQPRLATNEDVVITNAVSHVRRTIESSGTLISDLFTGARSGAPLVIVSRRVEVGGEPRALTLGVPSRQLGDVLREADMPEGWVAAVLDRSLHTVARTRAEDVIVGQPATPPVMALLAGQDHGLIRSFVTADGMPSVVAVSRAPRSGYAVAIAGPTPTGWRRLFELYGHFAGMSLALMAAALALSLTIGRRILVAVRNLGGGGDLAPSASGISEIDDVAGRLRSAEAGRDLLSRELVHRIKNAFALVSGITSMAARAQPQHKVFAADLGSRFHALAAASEQCLPQSGQVWQSTSVRALLRAITAPYETDPERPAFRIEGDDVAINGDVGNALALAFHEFVTNAVKYGALASGKPVAVSLALVDAVLTIDWREESGHGVAPASSGFGTALTNATIVRQLQGHIERQWREEGLRIILRIPLPAAGQP
jgi:two-component sensor histidine kinase